MAEMLTGVNGNIINWARLRYNMSENEAAASIGINTERYIDLEKGVDYPTYSMLKKISSVFKKPSALFFFPEPPILPDIKGELRSLPECVSSKLSKNVIIQFEQAQSYQINLRELYVNKYCILAQRANFPSDLLSICRFVREQISFPIEAQKARNSDRVVFEIFRDKLYQIGIYVFKDSFGDDSISGLCLFDEMFPVIIINNAMSFARQNFTLFHELFHLLSNTSGAEIIRDDYYEFLTAKQEVTEKSCDEFSNEFLVPTQDFIKELAKKDLTEQYIDELSKLYAVSKEAIMYKLLMLKKISSERYAQLKEYFYGDAIRKKDKKATTKTSGNYYYTKLAYLGGDYTGAVFNQYFSGKIDSFRASEMLNSKVDHLPKLETAFFRGKK